MSISSAILFQIKAQLSHPTILLLRCTCANTNYKICPESRHTFSHYLSKMCAIRSCALWLRLIFSHRVNEICANAEFRFFQITRLLSFKNLFFLYPTRSLAQNCCFCSVLTLPFHNKFDNFLVSMKWNNLFSCIQSIPFKFRSGPQKL